MVSEVYDCTKEVTWHLHDYYPSKKKKKLPIQYLRVPCIGAVGYNTVLLQTHMLTTKYIIYWQFVNNSYYIIMS